MVLDDSFPQSYQFCHFQHCTRLCHLIHLILSNISSYKFTHARGTCQPCLIKKMRRGTRLGAVQPLIHITQIADRLFATSKQLLPRYVQKARMQHSSNVLIVMCVCTAATSRCNCTPTPRCGPAEGRLPNVSSKDLVLRPLLALLGVQLRRRGRRIVCVLLLPPK